MAFKQNLIHRILNICNNKLSNQTLRNCRISPSSSVPQVFMPPNPDQVAPDPGDETVFRRFFHRSPMYLPSSGVPEILRPRTESMMQRLKEMDITRGRIRLDVLSPPAEGELTVADAKKILRVLQIEKVVKAIHGLLPTSIPVAHNGSVKELEEMERWKAAIDARARNMVQRELWGGLAYLVVQTAGFMRLTFWELSWDVMEPICFYVTSMYFMAGYTFFLRTAKEPSFEGFFESRFSSKQKKLMKREGFDVEKYKELRRACYPHQEAWPSEYSLVDDEGVKKTFT